MNRVSSPFPSLRAKSGSGCTGNAGRGFAPSSNRTGEGAAGFTLLEALIALAIVAIASAGLLRAVQTHIDTVRGLEMRSAARWVAENRLAELSLSGENQAGQKGQEEMLGQTWDVAVTARPSADADLRHVVVAVWRGGGAPVFTLDGFVDAGGARGRP